MQPGLRFLNKEKNFPIPIHHPEMANALETPGSFPFFFIPNFFVCFWDLIWLPPTLCSRIIPVTAQGIIHGWCSDLNQAQPGTKSKSLNPRPLFYMVLGFEPGATRYKARAQTPGPYINLSFRIFICVQYHKKRKRKSSTTNSAYTAD